MSRTVAIVAGFLGVVVVLLYLLYRSEFRADYQVRQAERRLDAAEFDRDFSRQWAGTEGPAEGHRLRELQERVRNAREELKRRQKELEKQEQASRVTEDKLRTDLNKFIEGEEKK